MKPAGNGRLWNGLRDIPRRIASVKAGSILIMAIFLFTLVAAFFPYTEAAGFIRRAGQVFGLENVSQLRELNFQERFEQPPFVALILALGLSLCLSLYFRARAEYRRWRAERAERPPQAAHWRRRPAVAAVNRELRRRGYRTRVFPSGGTWRVLGAKGGSGVLGSLLFHVAILLVLVAVLLSATASFRASVKLTEGQTFDSRTDAYGVKNAGRWYLPPPQPLAFRLSRVEPAYVVNGATTVASFVEPALTGRSLRFLGPEPLYVSHGLVHAGMSIHQGRETGYAPFVIVENSAGERLLQGYTRLSTMADKERESYADFVYVKDSRVSIELELLPDAVYRDGAYVARSGALKRPVLHAVVRDGGKTLFDRFIPATRDVTAGGYTVLFRDVRRWAQIDVSDAPGVPVLLAATLLGSLGLALRLLRVRRRVAVRLHGDGDRATHGFELNGSSEKFQLQFEEELASLRVALAEQLAKQAGPVGNDLREARPATGDRAEPPADPAGAASCR